MTDILIVDDERDIRELISEILKDEGFTTRLAANSDGAMEEIAQALPSLIILDIWLKDSDMDGIDILKAVKANHPEVPVVIISGHGNIEIAVAAIRQGAYDFIEKPFNIDQLLVVIRRAMETASLRRENLALRQQDQGSFDMIGACGAFKTLKGQLDKVTNSNGRVMLSGPAGVGKEVAARYIHQNSNRREKPFVTINCATMDPDTADHTLFGKETNKTVEKGLLERADGGVLFFDEVTDLPLDTQSRLLRVLVNQKFTRVGGQAPVQVDLRVVSATSRDLRLAIEQGTLREELYHRLNVVPISVPSLEERREDIPMLADHFITTLHDEQGLPKRPLSEDVRTSLQSMVWPGNVRQLRNVIERILILGPPKGDITANELPSRETNGPTLGEGEITLSGNVATMPLREARELFEKEYLITQVKRFGGNISRTAQFVGMERSALHRKLKSLGVATGGKNK